MKSVTPFAIPLFKNAPIVTFIVSASWVQTFIDSSMPVLQWIIALLGVVYAAINIALKWREFRRPANASN